MTETAEPKTYEPDDPANPNNLVMRGADGDPLPHQSGRRMIEKESYERVVEGLKTAADACQHIAKQETVQASTWIDIGAKLEKMRVEAVKLAGHDAEMKQEEKQAVRGDPYSWRKTRERLLDGMRQATGGMRQLATCFGGNSSWLLMAQQLARYEKNLRALLSPQAIHKTGNFLEVGPALFTPEDVQRFATQAKLAVPEGAHCLELAGGLSRSFWAALAYHEDELLFRERIKVLATISKSGSDFLRALGIEIDPSGNDVERNQVALLRVIKSQPAMLDLLRVLDEATLVSVICDVRRISGAAKKLSDNRPGPKTNVFVCCLLEELILQFHQGFGHRPTLKKDGERSRATPDVQWLRQVCLHVHSLVQPVPNLPPQYEALRVQLEPIKKWKISTFINKLEAAQSSVYQTPIKSTDH